MIARHKTLWLVAALAACSPSPTFPLDTDAGPGADATSDRAATTADATADGSVDAALVGDVVTMVDAPALDVPAAVDVPTGMDVASTLDATVVADVPVGLDVPAIPDAPPSVDAGSCPTGMALIPAGTFTMGDADMASLNAQPPHRVTVSAFCMDLTEVTVAAYGSCTASGCTAPGTAINCNWGIAGRGNHPVNCVDWNQARAYCRSLGGDLPTEAQWEYGARGTDGRIHPWGNAAPTTQLCWSGAGMRSSTCPVQSFPAGNSPFGLSDMAGNLFEWTADWYSIYGAATATDPVGPTSGAARVDRGGGWDATSPAHVRSPSRWGDTPTDRYPVRGFRCARTPL